MSAGSDSIYLDYAAATPLDERVFAAMEPFLKDAFYNPSSPYLAAKQVRAALLRAKEDIGRIVGGRASEIIFTAGATESINLAIAGVMARFPDGHMVTSAIEHPAVLQTTKQYNHTLLRPQKTGLVTAEALREAITDTTVLVSIGYVNNEIGTVQPIKDIAHTLAAIREQRLAAQNTTPLYFHTDAAQAAGYFELQTARLGVDMLTLNAAKCYGPKQVGLLWVRAGVQLEPILYGGGQEYGLRSGTENVAGGIGFGAALQFAEQQRKTEVERIRGLRDALQTTIMNALPNSIVSGHPKRRAPNNLHVAWPGIDGERLLYALDAKGIMVATGSACAANKGTRSHVLEAIGLEPEVADGSLRITLGSQTTKEEITRAAESIVEVVKHETAATEPFDKLKAKERSR